MVDELPEIGETRRDGVVVSRGICRVGVEHRFRQGGELGVACVERRQLREHPTEQARVLVA